MKKNNACTRIVFDPQKRQVGVQKLINSNMWHDLKVNDLENQMTNDKNQQQPQHNINL